ncbi:hypothetical protein DKX15_19275, partial [Enterococcus faecium]
RRQEVGDRGGHGFDPGELDRGIDEPQRITRVQAVSVQRKEIRVDGDRDRVLAHAHAVERDPHRAPRQQRHVQLRDGAPILDHGD